MRALSALRRRLKAIPAVSAGLALLEHAARAARHALPGHRRPPPPTLDESQRALLDGLARDGLVVVPGFWSPERCAATRAALDAFIAAHPERVWTDPYGVDQRVFGFERVDANARALVAEGGLTDVCIAHWGVDVVPGFVAAGRVTAHGRDNRGSGGLTWHRDGITQQLKAILYLTDVGPAQGPFQYVRGTRTTRDQVRHILRSGAVFRQRNWSDDQIAGIERTTPGVVTTALGAAGTLVLADTRGIHRGAPILEGTRDALTIYWFARTTLAPVAAYYAAQGVLADGRPFTVDALDGQA